MCWGCACIFSNLLSFGLKICMLKLEFMGEFLVYRLHGLEVSKVSNVWLLF